VVEATAHRLDHTASWIGRKQSVVGYDNESVLANAEHSAFNDCAVSAQRSLGDGK
jgi:hypothetical protein